MASVSNGVTAATRTFLFCDLRVYSAFVEARGDRAAAELLEVCRGLVRYVIATHDGAEIRTEGDATGTAIAVGPSSPWILDDGMARTARTVDPAPGATTATVKVGGLPGEAVFADGALWVTVHAP